MKQDKQDKVLIPCSIAVKTILANRCAQESETGTVWNDNIQSDEKFFFNLERQLQVWREYACKLPHTSWPVALKVTTHH